VAGDQIVVEDRSVNEFVYGLLGVQSEQTLIAPNRRLADHAPDERYINFF